MPNGSQTHNGGVSPNSGIDLSGLRVTEDAFYGVAGEFVRLVEPETQGTPEVKRTGSWAKMRINKGQEFVVGGFTPGPHGLDSIIVGYYRGEDLVYVARTRNGFVPGTRRRVYEKLKPLVTDKCPQPREKFRPCHCAGIPSIDRSRWR